MTSMSNDLDSPATKRDLSNLKIELIDGMQRIEQGFIGVRGEFTGLKDQFVGLKDEVSRLRNLIWLQIIVPALTLIISLVIHYILK
jgi:hypothetical protein